MTFEECLNSNRKILMEGALGERLKREYHLKFDEAVAIAGLAYNLYGIKALQKLWTGYIEIAKKYNLPFMATTPTRRANQDRVSRSRYQETIIKKNVDLLKSIRKKSNYKEMYIGGLLGCKGDAYKAENVLECQEAKEFHSWQCKMFQRENVDFLYAGIMPALTEAIGMAQAMDDSGLPYIISFMIQKNGRLIDGTSIHEAIVKIDSQVTRKPVCYMTNCIHPNILFEALSQKFNQTTVVRQRLRGIQANASELSPEELDGSMYLKSSTPNQLAESIHTLSELMDILIYGGCCGTDNHHIEAIARVIKQL